MTDWKRILSDNDEPLSEDDLLKYLNHNTSDEERQSIEENASGSFEQDALQGLQEIKNPEKVRKHVKQLKHSLKQQLQNKKYKREKKNIDVFQWVVYVILLLLITCVIGYLVIKMHNDNQTKTGKATVERTKK